MGRILFSNLSPARLGQLKGTNSRPFLSEQLPDEASHAGADVSFYTNTVAGCCPVKAGLPAPPNNGLGLDCGKGADGMRTLGESIEKYGEPGSTTLRLRASMLPVRQEFCEAGGSTWQGRGLRGGHYLDW